MNVLESRRESADELALFPPREPSPKRRTSAMRTLVIADPSTIDLVRQGLEADGTTVEVGWDRDLARYDGKLSRYEVILLDPKYIKDPGCAYLTRWRHEGVDAHILVL